MSRTVKILQYTLHSGSGDGFHRIMRDISVPLHQRHGTDVVWAAQSLYDPDCCILVRAFDSQESMSAVPDAFMQPMTGAAGRVKTLFVVSTAALKR